MAIMYYLAGPILLFAIRKYREYLWGYFSEKVDLKGQVIIVTGCTSGIGKETVRELLLRNATVIMACRNEEKTLAVYNEFKQTVKRGELFHHYLDLSSLSSVRQFAKEILAKYDRIDVLINNAGVACQEPLFTLDRFELNMGVNHFGHFLLTNLLLDRIKQSSPSRIVNVTSTLHESGKIDVDLLAVGGGGKDMFKRRNGAYSNSKLANVYFTRELALKVQDRKGVKVVCLCPGLCYTDIFRYANMKWYQYVLLSPIAYFYMRSANQGAQTVVFCAASKNIQSGKMYRNCAEYISKHKFDDAIQKQIWTKSEELIRLE